MRARAPELVKRNHPTFGLYCLSDQLGVTPGPVLDNQVINLRSHAIKSAGANADIFGPSSDIIFATF